MRTRTTDATGSRGVLEQNCVGDATKWRRPRIKPRLGRPCPCCAARRAGRFPREWLARASSANRQPQKLAEPRITTSSPFACLSPVAECANACLLPLCLFASVAYELAPKNLIKASRPRFESYGVSQPSRRRDLGGSRAYAELSLLWKMTAETLDKTAFTDEEIGSEEALLVLTPAEIGSSGRSRRRQAAGASPRTLPSSRRYGHRLGLGLAEVLRHHLLMPLSRSLQLSATLLNMTTVVICVIGTLRRTGAWQLRLYISIIYSPLRGARMLVDASFAMVGESFLVAASLAHDSHVDEYVVFGVAKLSTQLQEGWHPTGCLRRLAFSSRC